MVPETIAGKIVGGVCSLSGGILFDTFIAGIIVVVVPKIKIKIFIQFNHCHSACDRFACARYCV